jgi:hypothetical protein
MQYRNADRPLDYTPLQRTPSIRSFVTEALAWGVILAVPFAIWCAL